MGHRVWALRSGDLRPEFARLEIDMRRLFWLFTVLSLILVACGGGGDTAVSKEDAAKPESLSPTATKIVLNVNEYPLTQIGNSDKYQFLNAYASW